MFPQEQKDGDESHRADGKVDAEAPSPVSIGQIAFRIFVSVKK